MFPAFPHPAFHLIYAEASENRAETQVLKLIFVLFSNTEHVGRLWGSKRYAIPNPLDWTGEMPGLNGHAPAELSRTELVLSLRCACSWTRQDKTGWLAKLETAPYGY
jgi:hypothetical protein